MGVRHDPWIGHPSLYGGVSFLYVGPGENHFENSWFSQGSAYFLAVGILVDEGQSSYQAEVDSQGQGLHFAAGLLLQKGSQNQFQGGWGSLGSAGDHALGMLISLGGSNRYQGGAESIGRSRKPQALGLLLNLQSENSYHMQNINQQVQWPESPLEWPKALFMSKAPNTYLPEEPIWAINIDHDITADLLFSLFPAHPKTAFPFDPLQGWSSNNAYRPLEKNISFLDLLELDYEGRRKIYESIDLYHSQVDLAPLLTHPADLPEDLFAYVALWAMQTSQPLDLTELANNLSFGFSSIEIQRDSGSDCDFFAEINSLRPINEAKKLARWPEDPVFQREKPKTQVSSAPSLTLFSREMAIKLLGKKGQAEKLLAHLMETDSSIRNRALSAYYLAKLPQALPLLKPAFQSPFEEVRFSAAVGLRDSMPSEALPLIKSLFNDPSFYVRRAAALTAISMQERDGIPILLETLQYETLDTTENYGDNVYAKLAKYLGVDFGLNKQAWIDWWEQNGDHFTFPCLSSSNGEF